MSEIIKKLIQNSKDKYIVIFMKNGFKFEGLVKDCDDKFLLIVDTLSKSYKAISIDNISEVTEVQDGKKEKS